MDNEKTVLSKSQAYEAMIHMLNDYYESSGESDIAVFLGGAEYLSDGEPADPIFVDYWEDAVNAVLNGKKPKTQKLR